MLIDNTGGLIDGQSQFRCPRLFRTGFAETMRVEAFSDAVLAIVITLLVIEIRPPHIEPADDAALWGGLIGLAPKIVAWGVSFAFVLVFWVSHHYLFSALRQVDRGLLWINGVFLFFVTFVPFPTAFAGDYPLTRPPLIVLSVVMLCAAAAFSLMRLYVMRSDLLAEEAQAVARVAFLRSLIGPIGYAAATAAAAMSAAWACIGLLAGVPLFYFLAPPLRRPPRA